MNADPLKALTFSIRENINEARSSGCIRPEQKSALRFKVTDFKYGDNGVSSSGYSETATELSWSGAIPKVLALVKKSKEYAHALEWVANVSKTSNPPDKDLDLFVNRMITEVLNNPREIESTSDAIVQIFVKDLHQQPVSYSVEAKLDGVRLRPDNIVLDDYTALRKTKPEDLVKEFPLSVFFGRASPITPEAILKIESITRGTRDLTGKIDQSVTILRLFRVGSVRCLRYSTHSDSIIDKSVGGTVSSGADEWSLETYLVAEDDVSTLKRFWRTMSSLLPNMLKPEEADNYVTIGYRHYSNALMRNITPENRIAEAVKGLEALFTSDEGKGILYRIRDAIALLKSGRIIGGVVYDLKRRTSRVLAQLGHDLEYTKTVVNEAYEVSSIERHGRQLSPKRRRKLEKKYRTIDDLLKLVLEYLRTSIIMCLLSDLKKHSFLEMLDKPSNKDSGQAWKTLIQRTREIVQEPRDVSRRS